MGCQEGVSSPAGPWTHGTSRRAASRGSRPLRDPGPQPTRLRGTALPDGRLRARTQAATGAAHERASPAWPPERKPGLAASRQPVPEATGRTRRPSPAAERSAGHCRLPPPAGAPSSPVPLGPPSPPGPPESPGCDHCSNSWSIHMLLEASPRTLDRRTVLKADTRTRPSSTPGSPGLGSPPRRSRSHDRHAPVIGGSPNRYSDNLSLGEEAR